MLAAPLEQSAVPVALLATRLMTQTLYGGLNVFGIGSGGPNRQPTLVQFRLLPVSVEARLPRVSAVPLHAVTLVSEVLMSGTTKVGGTALLPPYSSPQARLRAVVPSFFVVTPQLPVPTAVVNCNRVGSGVPH